MRAIIPSDKMTPKERMMAFQAGKPLDRIPCCPCSISRSGIRPLGIKVRDFATDAKCMVDAAITCFKIYRPDNIVTGSSCLTISEAMGSKLQFPEDDYPQLLDPAIKTRSDIKKLSIADPKKDGKLPVYLEATRRCVDKIGDEVFVSVGTGGPFTTAAGLRGTENFLRDLYRDPELVHELLKASLESCLNLIDAVFEVGGSCGFGEPVASSSLISEKHFREFALPYISPVIKRLKSHSKSGSASLHICGKSMKILTALVETGATTLSLDQVDIAEVKRLVGDKVCLMGNVSPLDILRGTPEMIDASVYEILRKGYDNPRGFIMSTGCGVPTNTPAENIHAMMNAVRKYGAWPVHFDQS